MAQQEPHVEETVTYETVITTTEVVGSDIVKTEEYQTQAKTEISTKEKLEADEAFTEGSSVDSQTDSKIIMNEAIRDEYDATGHHDYIQSADEKALVRRLDYFLVMPCICVLNFLQYFDKSALSYAAVLGIKKDANISADQFAWLGSIFYLGYLVYQGPNAYLLQRVPIGRYLGVIIILWGFVLAMTEMGENFSQLAALRFLLGFFEAGVYSSCLMIISTLYRRREQTARIGLIYICNGVAMAVGGLIGYGIGHMDGQGGKSGWRWIMIILGSVTVAFGFFCFFFLIDNPKSKLICRDEKTRAILAERTLDNAVVRNKTIKVAHMIEAVKELRFWCFVFAALLINMQNGALSTYSSLITNSLGFSSLDAILLTIPNGVVDVIYILIAIFVNQRYGHTLPLACVLMAWSTIGLILLITIPVAKVKLLGLYSTWSYASAFVLLLTSLANNVAGYTKKVFYSSVLLVFYTIGNFLGPISLLNQTAPYVPGMVVFICANVASIVLLLIAHFSMARENRRRLESKSDVKVNVNDDLTDKENPNIIYRI
ncbi:MFS general substrate transporter [Hesseltinella vesiculosa]|uniref:MFS general substrate transporter n=1 Tax=Hesseltinella vesiculosa TaxID=101127 RepID=A0A1X2GEN5_9FUNG|nr:MFS general substrate transporter [Hesseltinella vesiculosa]